MVYALVLLSLVEVVIYQAKFAKPLRRILLIAVSLAVLGLSVLTTVNNLSLLYILIAAASIYRLVNISRVLKARSHEKYLRRAATKTAVYLGLIQVVLYVLDKLLKTNISSLLIPLISAQLIVALTVLISVIRNLNKTSTADEARHFSDKELPTVTVAIPARNETKDLEECLRSVLASDYPKLEIIVLDDCSHKETADIIKSFAHDGVRFVQGYEPTDDWLSKNLAYDRLADQSSGEYILFCGVDVRFNSSAIRAMINETLARNKKMMSVLPYRIESSIVSSLIQPIRYWWELALPRRFFAKPPVLSTCWLINRKSLEKLGGFEAIKRSIIPERFFARELIKSDEYSFLRSSGKMDIKTVKKVSSSKETVTRIRYPQLDRRPEYVYLLGVFEILFLVGPVILVCNLAVVSANLLVLFPLAAAVFLAISHMLIIQSTNPTKTIFSIFTYPLIILSDLIFTNVSMYKYEFATVDWKGRNVCTPVMRVYSKLPNISSKHRHKKR